MGLGFLFLFGRLEEDKEMVVFGEEGAETHEERKEGSRLWVMEMKMVMVWYGYAESFE